jgi:hypothetical protein
MTKASNFLLIVNAAANTADIWDRQSSGQITQSQAEVETGANLAFTGINYVGGEVGASVVAAASAGGGATAAGPVTAVAVGLTFFSFDMMVAQGTANNMIEGQPFWPAVWNARDSTIDELGGVVGKNHEDWDKFLGSCGIR